MNCEICGTIGGMVKRYWLAVTPYMACASCARKVVHHDAATMVSDALALQQATLKACIRNGFNPHSSTAVVAQISRINHDSLEAFDIIREELRPKRKGESNATTTGQG